MRLADLLSDGRMAVSVEAEDLAGIARALAGRMVAPDDRPLAKLLDGIAAGRRATVVRAGDDAVVLVGRLEEIGGPTVALATSRTPFHVGTEGDPDGARILVVVAAPRPVATSEDTLVPPLVRVLRDASVLRRLREAGSTEEIRGIPELMGVELRERLIVQDALTPLRYRIYPDTPLEEVLDLIVRRALHSVPVVGENLEVLGIITVGDALRHALPGKRASQKGAPVRADMAKGVARDVMTRTVMCVSEDQSLVEAANLLVNRDVNQLPVVREGELIGFLTREAVLERLIGTRGEP